MAKLFTFRRDGYGRHITPGVEVEPGRKGGHGVVLGGGRTGQTDWVGLDKFHPPDVRDGRVYNASPKLIRPRNGGREFVVFEKAGRTDTKECLVRLNCEGPFTRRSSGAWEAIQGSPEVVASGLGEEGSYRWKDQLVVVRPGDVIKISDSGGKVKPLVLFLEDGEPVVLDHREWETAQEAQKAAEPDGLKLLFGRMPAYTFQEGKLAKGLKTKQTAAGPSVVLGERGSGRKEGIIPALGLGENPLEAAVSATGTGQVILTDVGKMETGKVLVHVSTQWTYTRGSKPEVSAWRGSPKFLAEAHGAHGGAGNIYRWPDYLIVVSEGDVLYVRPEGGYKVPSFALWIEGGKPRIQEWQSWKLADAKREDPASWIERGVAPWPQIPAAWIGRVVTIQKVTTARSVGKLRVLDDVATGELVELEPLVIDLGWETGHPQQVQWGRCDWVKLEPEKKVIRLDPEVLEAAARRREQLQERLDEVLYKEPNRNILTDEWRERLQSAEFHLIDPDGIERAETALAEFAAVREDLEQLHTRIQAGETLPNFGGKRRRVGMTRNEDWWVIRPDGSLREADTAVGKSRMWAEIVADELALHWFCKHMGNVAANSILEVSKMPVGGCTEAQLAKAAEIERELGLAPGTFSL